MDTNLPLSDNTPTVHIASETGALRGILLHRPGVEIERMYPHATTEALYTDLLSHPIAAQEYALFSGIFHRWQEEYDGHCRVLYVSDLLAEALNDEQLRRQLVDRFVPQGRNSIREALLQMDNTILSHTLIEGYEDPQWDGLSTRRYVVEPLYNLFFTRDASSTLYDEVLINTMSFPVREHETLLYRAIFGSVMHAPIICAADADPEAHTEGGDILVVDDNTLCIGQSIRTNERGIRFLADHYAHTRERMNIVVQEMPRSPESFIHLDMVFTLLGKHRCMVFEPMLRKEGVFSGRRTTLITIEGGQITTREVGNVLEGLRQTGMDIEPIFCGGSDPWRRLREQWHSGANFFALDDERIIGYRRNTHTIDALDKAGFDILNAEDIVSGKVRMTDHRRFVATFPADELPRAGGGARCMTMPYLRA